MFGFLFWTLFLTVLEPLLGTFFCTFGALFRCWRGGSFLDPVFISFGFHDWGPFLVLLGYLFALGGDLGEAAFLKDLPCKILVFRQPEGQESLQKEIPKRF